MCSEAKQEARKAGRPALAVPEPINNTSEIVAKAILPAPPKKRNEWRLIQPTNPARMDDTAEGARHVGVVE